MKKSGGEKDKAVEGYGIWAEAIEKNHIFEMFEDVLACATIAAPSHRLKEIVANSPPPVILRKVNNLLLALYSSCVHKTCYQCQSLGIPEALPYNDEDYCDEVKSLCELKTLLMDNETPAGLKEDWPLIKELLHTAQEIGMDIGLRALQTETNVLTKQKNEAAKKVVRLKRRNPNSKVSKHSKAKTEYLKLMKRLLKKNPEAQYLPADNNDVILIFKEIGLSIRDYPAKQTLKNWATEARKDAKPASARRPNPSKRTAN